MEESAMTQPNATAYPLEDLLAEVHRGRVRIPTFQRAFRWDWEDVRRLVESIVKGYPIGSLLLWARPAEEARVELGALSIDAPKFSEALWVVDGQQRLTSLANALSEVGAKDPRFGVGYDLATHVFRKTSGRAVDEPDLLLPLPIAFDLQRLLEWLNERKVSSEAFKEATRVAKALREYKVPSYIVKQQDEAVLRDIFDRMNNTGKRLTRAEVFSALHGGRSERTAPPTLTEIVRRIEAERGFGPIDEDTVLRAVLARRGGDVAREIRLEFDPSRATREFAAESPGDAYRGAEDALLRTVAFVQDDVGVPHFGFLPYRYLIVVLARFFAHFPEPQPRNRELLRRWFWRAAVAGPLVARGSWTGAMRMLATRVTPDDESGSVQSLLAALGDLPRTFTVPKRFRSNVADSRVILCALWSLAPRSVNTGLPYDRAALATSLDGSATAAKIVPVVVHRGPRDRAGNRAIVLEDDTIDDLRARFGQPPLDMDGHTWAAVLASHAMTDDLCARLASGEDAAFIDGRDDLIGAATRRFVERMTEWAFEDTPPLDDLDFDDEEPRDDAAS